MSDILKEAITVIVDLVWKESNSIDSFVETLLDAKSRIPEEFRGTETVEIPYYEDDAFCVSYVRPPTAEERAEAEAIFADRARLIDRTSQHDMKEWVRNIRMRYCAGTRSLDLAEADEMIRNDEDVVMFHPKFNWKTKMVTD